MPYEQVSASDKTPAWHSYPPQQVLEELQAAKLIRAVHSERQLDELLVDFWMNHFNVYAQKGPVRFLLTDPTYPSETLPITINVVPKM